MTKTVTPVSFFLGANNKTGYQSLFGELYSPFDGGTHYILKGGPGTGKSTLMKKCAELFEKKGLYVERDLCSADPASLDAVSVPEIGFTVVDGTAPHTQDPVLPGVSEHIVDLSAAWDRDYLKKHSPEITELVRKNKKEHAKCAEYLWLASRAALDNAALCSRVLDRDKLMNFTKRLIKREIPDKPGAAAKGRVTRRFLSAVSPDGIFVNFDTLPALCERIITVEDKYGCCMPFIIGMLCAHAVGQGYDVIECRCPLLPGLKPEHLFIPELKLCFFTQNTYHYSLSDENRVRAARFSEKADFMQIKEKLAFNEKAKKEFINEAVRRMSAAKALHDELEKFYVNATDFSVIESLGKKIMNVG